MIAAEVDTFEGVNGARLNDTRNAFDSVAADYDGPIGNNEVIQILRARLLSEVQRHCRPGSRLLDIGCGTGIDAAYFASLGYCVVATDLSPRMVERTRNRARDMGLEDRISTRVVGMEQLSRLMPIQFDGIYSDLGAINCALDLDDVAVQCAALLKPGGKLVVSVIGSICPWEIAYYLARGDRHRATIRWTDEEMPVPFNGRTVWTRYYRPRRFAAAFDRDFQVEGYSALCLAAPPPYLTGIWRRFPRICRRAVQFDGTIGSMPLLRNAGDHFLMVLARRGRPHAPAGYAG